MPAPPTHAVDPVEEQATRVARPTHEELAAARCAGSCNGSATSIGSADHRPHDERGAADHEHVADVVGARRRAARPSRRSCRLRAHSRDGRAPRRARGPTRRSRASARARAPHSASCASSHCFQSNNGNAVAATVVDTIALPGERVVRDGLRHPVAARVGCSLRLPAQELRRARPLRRSRRAGRRGRARRRTATRACTGTPSSSTAVSDGTIAATETARGCTSPSASSARCGPLCQRDGRVVLEAQRRRDEELVRDARPGDDVAVGVGRDRFHRRRADIDPDRDVGHGGARLRQRRDDRVVQQAVGAHEAAAVDVGAGRRACSSARRPPR